MHDYKKLIVWQKGIKLAKLVYAEIKSLPKEETYALSDQIRRAVVSVPSNIAEGYGRLSQKELKHFLSIARGSLFEVETQLILCVELDFLSQESLSRIFESIEEISRILYSIITKLK